MNKAKKITDHGPINEHCCPGTLVALTGTEDDSAVGALLMPTISK